MGYIWKKCPTCQEDWKCWDCFSDICYGGKNIRECEDCKKRFSGSIKNAAIEQNAPILEKLDELSKKLDELEERLNNEN